MMTPEPLPLLACVPIWVLLSVALWIVVTAGGVAFFEWLGPCMTAEVK